MSWFLVNRACLLKKLSSTLAVTPSIDTLVEVLITYAALTLLRGTPLIQWGPVISKFPDSRLLRTTTLLPLCFPERRMTTCPGWIDLGATGFLAWHLLLLKATFSSSAGYHVFWLFLSLDFGDPPRTMDYIWYTEVRDGRIVSSLCSLKMNRCSFKVLGEFMWYSASWLGFVDFLNHIKMW